MENKRILYTIDTGRVEKWQGNYTFYLRVQTASAFTVAASWTKSDSNFSTALLRPQYSSE